MSIFNQRLDRVLREWMEPGLDHHLENGVGAHSYLEMVDRINDAYQPRITALRDKILKYLRYVGFQMNDSERHPQEQKAILALQQIAMGINRVGASLKQELASLQENQTVHAAPLILRRITRSLRNNMIGTYRNLPQIAQALTDTGMRPDPTIFSEVKSFIGDLDGDLRKVEDYFSQQVEAPAAGGFWDKPAPLDQEDQSDQYAPRSPESVEQLLQTPEYQWIGIISPTDLQAIVLQHPEHGLNEAIQKVNTIISYGPNYRSSGESLRGLVQAWDLDAQDILNNIPDWMPPESVQEIRDWLEGPDAAEYGL